MVCKEKVKDEEEEERVNERSTTVRTTTMWYNICVRASKSKPGKTGRAGRTRRAPI